MPISFPCIYMYEPMETIEKYTCLQKDAIAQSNQRGIIIYHKAQHGHRDLQEEASLAILIAVRESLSISLVIDTAL